MKKSEEGVPGCKGGLGKTKTAYAQNRSSVRNGLTTYTGSTSVPNPRTQLQTRQIPIANRHRNEPGS